MPTAPFWGVSVLGAIDRLIVEETHVLAVDFKTNADVPDRPEDVPEGLLRQMGAYAEMLRRDLSRPGIATAILWSRTAMLMELAARSGGGGLAARRRDPAS
jgi:ATP-dependent helicase/nuclease subunit A